MPWPYALFYAKPGASRRSSSRGYWLGYPRPAHQPPLTRLDARLADPPLPALHHATHAERCGWTFALNVEDERHGPCEPGMEWAISAVATASMSSHTGKPLYHRGTR